jgi:hypothetical protein
MRTFRILLIAALTIAPALTGNIAHAQFPNGPDTNGQCIPGINQAFQDHREAYLAVYNVLQPNVALLTTQLRQVTNQATYQVLLTTSRNIANFITHGRLVITLPDGTVVLDTARPDDPTNVLAAGNSYQHFQNKTVNENHNSRVAIFSAQQYPCGVGIESKFSTTTGNVESYVALRLGPHLDSEGTIRGSTF